MAKDANSIKIRTPSTSHPEDYVLKTVFVNRTQTRVS